MRVSVYSDTAALSVLEPLDSAAPSEAKSSASLPLLRVLVPSSSMSAVNDANPGLATGLRSLPASTTKLADSTGNRCCSNNITVRPLGKVKRLGTGKVN